uniref:Uncharacterized protein n=1 Tax=Triticum urartu TaxID=4572 RepID=A0A8R7U9K1_TRIUA
MEASYGRDQNQPRRASSLFAARRRLGRRRRRPDADPLLLVLDVHGARRDDRVHLQEQRGRLVVLDQRLAGAELHQ